MNGLYFTLLIQKFLRELLLTSQCVLPGGGLRCQNSGQLSSSKTELASLQLGFVSFIILDVAISKASKYSMDAFKKY